MRVYGCVGVGCVCVCVWFISVGMWVSVCVCGSISVWVPALMLSLCWPTVRAKNLEVFQEKIYQF